MPNQTLDDLLTYIETKGATVPALVGNIKVTRTKEPYPGVIKDYGLQVYIGSDKPVETIRKKIGPITIDQWQINCDLVLNKAYRSRELYSKADGVSFWINTLVSTFINGTNNGAFKNSSWEFLGQEDNDDTVVIRGMFHVEVQNTF